MGTQPWYYFAAYESDIEHALQSLRTREFSRYSAGDMAIPLPPQWAEYLRNQPETGMDYHVVSVWLTDGRRFDQAVATGGQIIRIRGHEGVPFTEADIARIKVTHHHWRS